MQHAPVIIIAAARSGTKMLRHVLSASQEIVGYPYDANYIWKYGNYKIKHDEIAPESIDEKQKDRIRNFFLRLCDTSGRPRLLEKSVPNSLRIPFVRSVFPNCKIVHLYRNGLDVAGDARLCWQDSASSERIQSKKDRLRKLKEFPLSMAWPYLLEYGKGYAKKTLLKQTHVESWGPRYKGIDEDVRNKSLIEVCSIQWAKCIEHCCRELQYLCYGKDYINVSYESLIMEPEVQLGKIVDFIGLPDGSTIINRGKETICSNFLNSWHDYLTRGEAEKVMPVVQAHQKLLANLTE